MKQEKGITLIALIITIILLLLLATVVMSTFKEGNIISNSEKAVEMHKIESVREEIQMAIIRKTIVSDREITIEQIIEELEKQGIINSGDGNSETGQVKTQPDGYIYEIKEKANGDFEVIYIGKGELTLPELLITLSPNTTGITSSVTITMTAKAKSGITSYTLPKGTEQSVESGTKEITKTYTATENGTYTFTVTNGNRKTESKSITIDNILEGTIQISANPTTPTKGNVTVTVTWPRDASRAIKEIQVGEGSWEVCTGEVNTVEVMVNCTIKARVRNSIEEIKTATCTINNIDKKAPKTFNPTATATSNSITISGSTEDEAETSTNGSSGIGAYYFQIDGGEWVTNANKTQTSYTFTGLNQGTSHTLKMKAVDKAGNETITNSISVSTINIASLGDITITPSNSMPTNQNITVSVTWPSETTGYTKKISIDNGATWSGYTGAVTITENCIVKARLEDSTSQTGKTATCEIDNIDKTNPTVTATAETVTIKEGDSHSLKEYFTVVANGKYGIASTVYTDTSNGNAEVANTNTLAVGTHIIKCTATKETGASASATKIIVVEPNKPDGSESNPYLIEYIEDLVDLSLAVENQQKEKYEGKYFKLMTDLDFNDSASYKNASDTSYGDLNETGTTQTIKEEMTDTAGKGFPSIGGYGKGFTGIFLGNNKEIKNVYIKKYPSIDAYIGFFGKNDGTIKDLTLSGNVETPGGISGVNLAGIAYINNGNIENCINKASVTGHSINGAAAGIAYSNSGTIKKCKNQGIITVTFEDFASAAGIIAYNSGTVINCMNEAKINSRGDQNGGGIAVSNSGTIKNCYNKGEVDLTAYPRSFSGGGIAGRNSGTIENCYNSAVIKGGQQLGGIVGWNDEGVIKNCYNSGDTQNALCTGGMVGVMDLAEGKTATIENCYNDGDMNGTNEKGGIIGAVQASSTSVTSAKVILTSCGYLLGTATSGVAKNNSVVTVEGTAKEINVMPDKLTILNAGQDEIWEYDTDGNPTLKNL